MHLEPNWVLDLPWIHHKLTQPRFGKSHQFSFIVYFGLIHEGYIEMIEILKSPKMDSLN
jgi:hypothetical protein